MPTTLSSFALSVYHQIKIIASIRVNQIVCAQPRPDVESLGMPLVTQPRWQVVGSPMFESPSLYEFEGVQNTMFERVLA